MLIINATPEEQHVNVDMTDFLADDVIYLYFDHNIATDYN